MVDCGNHRIQHFATDTTSGVTVAGGTKGDGAEQLDSPENVAVDTDGGLYVAGMGDLRIQYFAKGSSSGIQSCWGLDWEEWRR